MEHKRYTVAQKKWALGQMKSPQNQTVVQLARDSGITTVTLRHWRDAARADGELVPAGLATEKWSSADKFRAVLEAAPLSQAEVAQFCRANAILPEQLAQWRQACEGANGQARGKPADNSSAPEQEVVSASVKEQIRLLERELRRKNAALAETAALLVLGKKADAIWGRAQQPAEDE